MSTTTLRSPAPPIRLLPLRVLPDERLAELVHGGDDAAFTVLYERYRVSMSRYCTSIVHNAEDAADAHQNAMLAALRGLQSRPPTDGVRPWMFRIAHNESVSVLRRRRPHEQLSDETPAPSGEGLGRERWRTLLADLRSLPERQRGALVMRELGGLEYSEIGAALGISGPVARKAVFEARVGLSDLVVGRETGCEEVRVRISDGDRRVLRGRQIRGHLDACAACAAFERGISERRRVLGLIPVLPAMSAGYLFAGGIGAAAGPALPAGATGVVLGSGSAGTALAIKGIALCGACALAGAGVIVGGGLNRLAPGHGDRPAPMVQRVSPHAAASARPGAGLAPGDHARSAVLPRSSARPLRALGQPGTGTIGGRVGSSSAPAARGRPGPPGAPATPGPTVPGARTRASVPALPAGPQTPASSTGGSGSGSTGSSPPGAAPMSGFGAAGTMMQTVMQTAGAGVTAAENQAQALIASAGGLAGGSGSSVQGLVARIFSGTAK